MAEPSIQETVQILSTLALRYGSFHDVEYAPAALEAAAKLSDRYLPDRYLPDKAVALMDEAGAAKQNEAFFDGGAASGGGDGARPVVDAQDVAKVISSWTGVPLSTLTDDEAASMMTLEDTLQRRLVGQANAVSAVARSLRRARAGLSSADRPVASMLFCGPTGVGKTELAKAVAALFFGSEKDLIRIDMSEYMEPNSVTRLTGPPPGYVGYEAGGQLTEAVRRAPRSVVLFDEVEKAHPDVFNVLLQVRS